MSTVNPRIPVTIDKDTRDLLVKLAKRDNTSLANKASEYFRVGLALSEDVELASIAVERMKTSRAKYVSHNEVWK